MIRAGFIDNKGGKATRRTVKPLHRCTARRLDSPRCHENQIGKLSERGRVLVCLPITGGRSK